MCRAKTWLASSLAVAGADSDSERALLAARPDRTGRLYLSENYFADAPKRAQPDIKAGQIAAPTDGQILMTHHDRENARYLVRLRPDWFNSHITFAPIDGLIDQQIWYDGDFAAFGDAEMPGPSSARQEIIFLPSADASVSDGVAMTYYGEPFCPYIAKLFARGTTGNPSMAVALGLVRPKIDISFPDSNRVMVVPGQRCLSGETILADKS